MFNLLDSYIFMQMWCKNSFFFSIKMFCFKALHMGFRQIFFSYSDWGSTTPKYLGVVFINLLFIFPFSCSFHNTRVVKPFTAVRWCINMPVCFETRSLFLVWNLPILEFSGTRKPNKVNLEEEVCTIKPHG